MSKNFSLRSLLVRPEVATFLMFLAIMIGFYIANERFLDARNIRIVMGITPEYIIVAIGIAILMISGEFDFNLARLKSTLRYVYTGFAHIAMPEQ